MKKWHENLAATSGQIVKINRSPEIKDKIEGYVVGVSDLFVMLHALDGNYINLNGYIVLRVEDIHNYRVRDDYEFFLNRALKLQGIDPVPQQEINLSSHSSLFSSANEHFPLICIHREIMDGTTCFIGRVKTLTAKTITLNEIDPGARWKYTRRYNFKDITRIDFGGGYEATLALVAAHDAQSK